MKIRSLILSCGVALAAASLLHAESPAPAAKAEHHETELEKTMTRMGKAWRQVRKAARDGQLTPATAEWVATVRTGAQEALKLTPALEREQPEAARAKFQADYETQMKKLVATLTELEAALKANDTDKAAGLIGDVGDAMKSGHHDFRRPEEHR